MKWVSRRDWGARYGRGPTNITPSRGGVAIHWEGGKMGWPWDHSKCDDKVRQIERYHVEGNRWSAIAYTLLVCGHGFVYEGRGLRHRTAANGTNSGNQNYYAICALLGKGDPHPADLFAGIRDGIDYLRRNGAGNGLRPHSYFYATECCGDRLRRWISDGAQRPSIPTPAPEEDDPMPEYVHVTGTAKEVPPGVWTTVSVKQPDWDKSYSHVLDGWARVNGYAYAKCKAPEGTEVQVRVVETDDGKTTVREAHPWGEGVAKGGSTPAVIPVVGDLQDKRDLRVQVEHWASTPVDVDVTVRLHYWKKD